MTEENNTLDTVEVERILKLLPHRYPFLLVDRVIDYKLGEHLTAIKNVTFNEPHFNGHFPNHPVMPGVLIIEAMAQASGILSRLAIGDLQNESDIFYLVKVDKAKFTKTVIPGDQLHLCVSIKSFAHSYSRYEFNVEVLPLLMASITLLFMTGFA